MPITNALGTTSRLHQTMDVPPVESEAFAYALQTRLAFAVKKAAFGDTFGITIHGFKALAKGKFEVAVRKPNGRQPEASGYIQVKLRMDRLGNIEGAPYDRRLV